MNEPSWIGQTLSGRYRIETLLGQGGMSAVYRATDPNLQRVVAVKMIHTHLSNSPDFVQRFEREAAAVARLRHSNIIQVYDFNHDGDTYYIVFEFVPGETLQDRLRRLNSENRRLSIEEAVNITAAVAEALEYAHQHELIHRDIKPANVMLNPRGEPVLMDFGIAKIVDSTQRTATGVVLGTARYMSPEQIKGERVDARTDLYSLGVMLFEMVSGRAPYESDSAMTMMMMHIHDPAPNIADLRPDVPAPLAGVIARALSKDPQQRYASAAEMAAALRNVLAAPSLASPRTSAPTMSETPLAATEVVSPPPAIAAAPAYASPPARASEFPTPAPLPRTSPPTPRQKAKGNSLKWIILGGAALFLLVFGLLAFSLAARFLMPQQQTASDGQAGAALVDDRPSPTPMPEVTITNITTVSDFYVVQYNIAGFEESLDGMHLHFFFNTTPPQEAGRPFSNFFMYGGPSPYAEIRLSDKPEGATKLCALVANPDHTIQGESGNCFDLPASTGAAPSPATATAPLVAAATAALTATPSPTLAAEAPVIAASEEPTTPALFVRILSISIQNGVYLVDYTTEGFTEALPGVHIHFFFDTVRPENAGLPASGPWYVWGGPRPFNGYRVIDKPAIALQLCALVANSNHTVQPGTGNCFTLPNP